MIKNRKWWVTATVSAIVLLAAPNAHAATVDWMGATWDNDYRNATIEVVDGDLEVSSDDCNATVCWGTAHTDTPQAFRDAAEQAITVSFEDEGPGTPGGQLWIEQEAAGTSSSGGWTQFGVSQTRDNYYIFEWDYSTNQMLTFETAVTRTAGEHTFTVGKREGGTVDYYIDGVHVYTAQVMHLDYLGDVYLAANSTAAQGTATITFTGYSTSTDYDGPPPVPTSKDDCRDGGWRSYDSPSFRNQGQCMAFVASASSS